MSVKQEIHIVYLFYMIPEEKKKNNKEIHSCLSRLTRCAAELFSLPKHIIFSENMKASRACLSGFFYVIHNQISVCCFQLSVQYYT